MSITNKQKNEHIDGGRKRNLDRFVGLHDENLLVNLLLKKLTMETNCQSEIKNQ